MKNNTLHKKISMYGCIRSYTIMSILMLIISCSSNADYRAKEAEETAEDPTEEVLETAEAEKVVDYEFEKEMISGKGLRAFEQMAIQKLEDFAGYVSIVSDHSLEKEFRAQAESMLLGIFSDKKHRISFSSPDTEDEESVKIQRFVKDLGSRQASHLLLNVTNISIAEALDFAENNEAFGRISCIIDVVDKDNDHGHIPRGSYQVDVDIILSRTDKDFGDSKKEIWEVFLGNMYFVGE